MTLTKSGGYALIDANTGKIDPSYILGGAMVMTKSAGPAMIDADTGKLDPSVVPDIGAPKVPVVSCASSKYDSTPTFTWTTNWRYRIDAGAWVETTDVNFTTGALTVGEHTLEVEAKNTVGGWTAAGSKTFTYDGTLPLANVVCQYNMNDNAASTVVAAAVGVAAASTANTSTKHVAGKLDGALNFNGSNDKITCTTNTGLPQGDAPFSLECWVQFTDEYDYMCIMHIGSAQSGRKIAALGRSADKKIKWNVYGTEPVIWDGPAEHGVWYHIVGCYDGSAAWRGYVNGMEYTGSFAGNMNIDTNMVCFGAFSWGGQWLKGDGDVWRVYNKALTAGEVALLYNAGAGIESLSV